MVNLLETKNLKLRSVFCIPELPRSPPELMVRNRELIILAGQSGSQVVTVRNPIEEAPKLSLAYPATLAPSDDPDASRIAPIVADIKSVLEAALNRAPSRDESNPLAHEFYWPLDLRVPDRAKVLLADLEGGLGIPIDVTLPGAKPIRWLLRLEAQTKNFPGWVVVDFGTTNSTVTLHDTWDYSPFEGFPDEQEDYLRQSLADWLRLSAHEALERIGRRHEGD